MSDKRPSPSPSKAVPSDDAETLNTESGATPTPNGRHTARATSPQLPAPGALIAERYRVGPVLGEGGMGVVVEAQNVVTGKRVALKWMHPSAEIDVAGMQRLVREAQVAARIHHPNVIDVYDVGEHQGALFLVEELLHGEPLSAHLKRGPVDPARLIATLLPVLDALSAAHRQGVVHRDVKPSNIFLCVDDQGHALAPKLLDFGTSSIQKQKVDESLPTLTKTGAVIGTPHFMAPEQLDEARNVDSRADIYSMGVLLYQGLSGTLPYQADSYSTLVLRVVSGDHEPLRRRRPELPADLCAVVERAMAIDRETRFADATELKTALQPHATGAWLHDAHAKPASPSRPLATAPHATKARTPAIVAALVVLLSLVGAWLALRNDPIPVAPAVSPVTAAMPVPSPHVDATPEPPKAPSEPAAAATENGASQTEPPANTETSSNKRSRRPARTTQGGTAVGSTSATPAPSATHPLDLRSDDF